MNKIFSHGGKIFLKNLHKEERKIETDYDSGFVPKTDRKNVDIFDNQDIVSMLAANKLGKTNSNGESEGKKEITQLFSAQQ